MLRALSIRNFVVVESLDVEFESGFTVLTGETGAGKSILVDALALLIGDRFELRQLRAGAARAELTAMFDAVDAPLAVAWLEAEGLTGDDAEVLLRRTLDAQGRSRAWINGRPATLAQLAALGEMLVDLHGQNAHQALARAPMQRALLDAYGGFASLARETAEAFRLWRSAAAALERARADADAVVRERVELEETRSALAALAPGAGEWAELAAVQSRLANAASLIEAAASAQAAIDGDDAMLRTLHVLALRLSGAAVHDATLVPVVTALESVTHELGDVAHSLRDYLRRIDADPAGLRRIEERQGALHDAARRFRVRPEDLPALSARTAERIEQLLQSADIAALENRVGERHAQWRAFATILSGKRRLAAAELANRVSVAMQELAMPGGRFEVHLMHLDEPLAQGLENVEFDVATHPAQPPGPLARVASGGELARIALAIQVATSEVASVPTLVFDEVDTGIGGAVAATVGKLLQSLGSTRQVLCVTHLAQVAAHADHHMLVRKLNKPARRQTRSTPAGNTDAAVASELVPLASEARVDELARMMGGAAITAKTREHALELYQDHRRPAARSARRATNARWRS